MPEQMKQSVAEHRAQLDTVQMWLDDKAELVEGAWTPSATVVSSYTACTRHNETDNTGFLIYAFVFCELFDVCVLFWIVSWRRPEGLMREETMTMFVYRINRLRTIRTECVVLIEAIGEQAVAVMTSYSHRDR